MSGVPSGVMGRKPTHGDTSSASGRSGNNSPTRARMAEFAAQIREDGWRDVVNIGIGGSHLGPEMTVRALAPYHDGPRCHFVSNVDGADIADTLAGLDPARTVFIIASKTFTTIETMTNAATARDWLRSHGRDPGALRRGAAHQSEARAPPRAGRRRRPPRSHPRAAPLVAPTSPCAICMSMIVAEDAHRLQCGHAFHTDCLREMAGHVRLSSHTRRSIAVSCPLCRKVTRAEVG